VTLSVPNIYPTRSRYESVLVNEAAKDVGSSSANHVRVAHRGRHGSKSQRRLLVQRAMGTMPVVGQEVLGQNLLEVAVPKYEKAVQALSTDGPHEALSERVIARLQLHPAVKVRAVS
jgi:hypothetical protein